MMYVYKESERWSDGQGFVHVLHTVGFYTPDGEWEPESDHSSESHAAARVAYLNGGKKLKQSKAISEQFECNPAKMGLDKNPFIQMDIDRFIGHLKSEIANIDRLLVDPEATLIQESEAIRTEMERMKDFYEGLLGTIEANSFK
jgi:hypothetical protein